MKQSLLHQAILNNQLDLVEKLKQEPNELTQKNELGFTPIEMAKLLNKQLILNILQPEMRKKILKITPKSYSHILNFTPLQFENFFGVQYLTHQHFSNYNSLKNVIHNCPLILRFLGEENHSLGEKYKEKIYNGFVANVSIRWIDEKIGYGVFAEEDIEKNSYIGEYVGLVRRLYRANPDANVFCFHYPTKFWSWNYYVVDALNQGNEIRFINHSNTPNLTLACAEERKLLHLLLFANEKIPKGNQLTFNYGADFWRHRFSFQEV